MHYQFSCAPKLARKYEIEHWCPVVRTDGRCTVTSLPDFLGWVDYLSYGAPPTRAWSSAINHTEINVIDSDVNIGTNATTYVLLISVVHIQ